MASLREALLRSKIQQAQQAYGRAGGIAPGAATRPIPGVQSAMAGPVQQQNFGPPPALLGAPQQAAPQPVPQVAPPAPPVAAPNPMAEALRNYTERPDEPNPVQTVAFHPPELKGEVIEDELPHEHTGGDYLAPTTLMHHGEEEEDNSPIDLGVLPEVRIGGDERVNDINWNAAAQELASRMLRSAHRKKHGGPTNKGVGGSVRPWEN